MELTFLEDRAGTLSWSVLRGLVAAVQRSGALPDDFRHTLKERLKSEVLPLVLNSLTVCMVDCYYFCCAVHRHLLQQLGRSPRQNSDVQGACRGSV
jgi:hypothetical protein